MHANFHSSALQRRTRSSSQRLALLVCLRRVQRWSVAATFDEYRRHAGTKVNVARGGAQAGTKQVELITL